MVTIAEKKAVLIEAYDGNENFLSILKVIQSSIYLSILGEKNNYLLSKR